MSDTSPIPGSPVLSFASVLNSDELAVFIPYGFAPGSKVYVQEDNQYYTLVVGEDGDVAAAGFGGVSWSLDQLPAASAEQPGALSVADFDKLATVPDGIALCPYIIAGPFDLVAGGNFTLLAPVAKRLGPFSFSLRIATKGGTVSVGPTVSIGTNSPNFDNVVASAALSAFTTQAVNTSVGLTIVSSGGIPCPDLTTSGLVMKVTGATGTLPVLTAYFTAPGFLLPV